CDSPSQPGAPEERFLRQKLLTSLSFAPFLMKTFGFAHRIGYFRPLRMTGSILEHPGAPVFRYFHLSTEASGVANAMSEAKALASSLSGQFRNFKSITLVALAFASVATWPNPGEVYAWTALSVSMTARPTSGQSPLAVSFSATASQSNVTYAWNF